MLLPRFEYLAPKTIDEACSLLSQYKGKARVIAGGTDLLVQMKHREITPQYLINIKAIPNLDYITYDEEAGLSIGALATIRAIETSPLIKQRFGILTQAAAVLGSVQVRNRGTIGGNICNAAPSADTAPALITLAAKARIIGLGGERTVAVEDFFTGPEETVLQADEILTEIKVPNLPPQSNGVYLKHTLRRAMDIAIIGVAVVVTLDGGGKGCKDAKIALGTVAPTPIRAKGAEDVLRGQEMSEELIEKAARIAAEESHPRDSVRGSAWYRRKMVEVLTRRALQQAKGG
jgi:carbon-monoxide dehydrogenase medium subunit